jgi:PAS domain S-box-containing protein
MKKSESPSHADHSATAEAQNARPDAGIATGEEHYRHVLEALPAALFTTDAQGQITFYNRAWAELTGRPPDAPEPWRVTLRLFRPDGTELKPEEYPLAVTLRENRPVRGMELLAERHDGTRVPLLPYPTPLYDASGNLIGALNMLVDISERKSAEVQQRALRSELNHRVKNNMQMLQSLLGAAEREAQSPEARAVLGDAARRVGAMAAAQHSLYDADTSRFEARPFVEALCRNASQAFGRHADIHIEETSGVLSNDAAVPLALIVNELITNAVRHGKGGRTRVGIKISLVKNDREWTLSVEDDGPGFEMKEPRRRASGLGLVSGLARQLGGTLEVTMPRGARCVVRFGGMRAESH